MTVQKTTRSHPSGKGWLRFFLLLLLGVVALPLSSPAHPSPNTLLFLDASPGRVLLEIQMPVPELELAFGHDISRDPQTVAARLEPQLKEYLLAHIHAYTRKDRPWAIRVSGLRMDRGKYADSNIPYWEVEATVELIPLTGEDTRHFFLDYSVIMHQVMNHVALISIRKDWETGKMGTDSTEAGVIGWDLKNNTIPPLEVDLGRGSWWKGFGSMFALGMEHIREGTDHLLFLIVLLLPAMLLVQSGRWGGFGGVRSSLLKIVRIVTAFTVGHSCTLMLAALGWVQLPGRPVEILIAVSILVSAVHAMRPLFPGKENYIAAGFGLIHGLAFATVLSNLNLGPSTLALSILGFNLGIEAMQLFIVVLVIPWLIILSKRDEYRWIRMGGAAFAVVASLAWILQRTVNQPNPVSTGVEEIAGHGTWIVSGLILLALSSLFWPGTKRPSYRSV